MNLIERYVYAVTRQLPANQRSDIEKEIRAMIDDLVMDRKQSRENVSAGIILDEVEISADTPVEGSVEASVDTSADSKQNIEAELVGTPVSEANVRAVLEQLGDPAMLAQQYRGKEKYIIGPVLYDTYLLVLKIVLLAAGIGLLIAKSIQLATETFENVWIAFSGMIGSLYQGLLSAFAMVTLIFILVEYFGGKEIEDEIKKEKKPWRIEDLPEAPSKKLRIKRGDPVANIIFTLIFMVIINVFPQLFGFFQQTDTGLQITGFLGDGFTDLLIYINIVLVLGVILEAVKIAYARWTWFLVVTCLMQNILSLIVSLRVIRADNFINPDFITTVNQFLEQSNVDVSLVWQNPMVTGLTILVVLGYIVDSITIASKGYRLVQSKNEF